MDKNTLIPELIAEAFGTFILVLFGTASVAMVVLFAKGAPGEVVNGGYTNITIAWGLAVTMAIYLTARISGAHLNPAVTIALAAFRGFPWAKTLPYCLVQIAGGFLGAAVTYLNYRPAILRFDPDLSRTAGVFSTFPAFPEAPLAGFIDQVIGTALLLIIIFALSDENNLPPASNLAPVLVGLGVVLIGMSFGALHGYAINPARDFGPRLFTAIAGFKNNGLTDGTNIFLVPLLAPILGGLLGATLYDLCIRRFLSPVAQATDLSLP
ncbi:MAG TPA: MIP/aquaporin family protein [Bryobacteraceae bacterium]|nr:MIP/aquaporin family protein [Bryobacteraceae bacterium]